MTAAATMPVASAAAPVKKNSNFQAIVKRLFQNRGAVIGLIIFIVLALAAILAPVAAPYGYEEMDLTNMLSGPSLEHLFGTDELGRDVFSRIIYGGRYSLSIGLVATAFGAVVGCAIGAITGYFGGTFDTVLMRFLDILEAIPGLLLTICVSAVLGSGFDKTILALAITSIPQYVRLLRAQVFSVRDEEYLEAAESISCSKFRIITRYVLPNSLSPVIVKATMSVAQTILTAASLSYVGLGVQPPAPEWGAMLSAGRAYIRSFPHLVMFPGIFIMITVLGLNLFGDGLRDALDPKLKK